jgi:hypothetical protein
MSYDTHDAERVSTWFCLQHIYHHACAENSSRRFVVDKSMLL